MVQLKEAAEFKPTDIKQNSVGQATTRGWLHAESDRGPKPKQGHGLDAQRFINYAASEPSWQVGVIKWVKESYGFITVRSLKRAESINMCANCNRYVYEFKRLFFDHNAVHHCMLICMI